MHCIEMHCNGVCCNDVRCNGVHSNGVCCNGVFCNGVCCNGTAVMVSVCYRIWCSLSSLVTISSWAWWGWRSLACTHRTCTFSWTWCSRQTISRQLKPGCQFVYQSLMIGKLATGPLYYSTRPSIHLVHLPIHPSGLHMHPCGPLVYHPLCPTSVGISSERWWLCHDHSCSALIGVNTSLHGSHFQWLSPHVRVVSRRAMHCLSAATVRG